MINYCNINSLHKIFGKTESRPFKLRSYIYGHSQSTNSERRSYLKRKHLQCLQSHYKLLDPRHPKSYVISLRASSQKVYMNRERCGTVVGFHGSREHDQLINNRLRKRLAVECVEKRVDTAFQIIYQTSLLRRSRLSHMVQLAENDIIGRSDRLWDVASIPGGIFRRRRPFL